MYLWSSKTKLNIFFRDHDPNTQKRSITLRVCPNNTLPSFEWMDVYVWGRETSWARWCVCMPLHAVWPDVGIKRSASFQKVVTGVFTKTYICTKIAQKYKQYFCYFLKIFCCQELPLIALSGRTAHRPARRALLWETYTGYFLSKFFPNRWCLFQTQR